MNIFNLVLDTMTSKDRSFYRELLLDLFKEFGELKYVVDPTYEKFIVTELLYNLMAFGLCRHNTYLSMMWTQRYNGELFDPSALGWSALECAEHLSLMMDAFANNETGELEIIRILIHYAKCKGYDIENIFVEYVKKLEKVEIPL